MSAKMKKIVQSVSNLSASVSDFQERNLI
jgi:hypothetical protein